MAFMRSNERRPLDYGAEGYEEEGLEDESGKSVDEIKRARVLSAVANAVAQRTSAPIETAFYAFTGEKLPSHQGPGKVVTPLDYMQQEGEIREGESQEELRKAQIEKYLADARKQEGAAAEDWVDTGMRSKGADGSQGLAIFMNRKTGETREAQVPPGTYDRVDVQTAPALMRAWDQTAPSGGGMSAEERRKQAAFEADQKRKQAAWEAEQKRKGQQAPKGGSGLPGKTKDQIKRETVTDKEAEAVQDFDASILAAERVAQKFTDPDYVGPADALKPDWYVGPKESAFRSEVQQMFDAYRKLITGAGASVLELKSIEKSMPSLKDREGNFKEKLVQYIDKMKAQKNLYLKNLESRGRSVKAFGSAPQAPAQAPAGAVRLKDRDGWWVKTPDGKAYKRVQ